MLKKIIQIIFLICLIFAAAIVQYSFIFALPTFFSSFNLILIILVFSLFFYDFRSALGVALVGGFWLDLFSFHFFGFYILGLFLTAWLADRILRGWLTNRSLYSFGLLMLLATLAYNFLAGFFVYFFATGITSQFFLGRRGFWLDLAYQIAWGELAALLMFSLAGAATRRLKPFFLEKK